MDLRYSKFFVCIKIFLTSQVFGASLLIPNEAKVIVESLINESQVVTKPLVSDFKKIMGINHSLTDSEELLVKEQLIGPSIILVRLKFELCLASFKTTASLDNHDYYKYSKRLHSLGLISKDYLKQSHQEVEQFISKDRSVENQSKIATQLRQMIDILKKSEKVIDQLLNQV